MVLPKKGTYDKKFFRLLSILNKFNRGEKVSAQSFAQEFYVNVRTIQRDIDLLKGTGFLVTSPEKGIYSFEKGFSLSKIQLTGEEASLLSFMYEVTKSLGKDFEGTFRSVLSKVIQKEYEYPYYAKIPNSSASLEKLPYIKELEDAVCENYKINLTYKKEDELKEHRLCPLKIILFDGFWYLLAQEDKKSVFVNFDLIGLKK